MNNEVIAVYQDQTQEYNGLVGATAPPIDLTDFPLNSREAQCLASGASCTSPVNPSNYLVTSPISQGGYFELEFNLANTFWGCHFDYGNSLCGVNIRQGIAHLVDKNSLTTNEPAINVGHSTPIDNPVPPIDGLVAPNPCNWDLSHSQSINCVVGSPGGTAYHLSGSSGQLCNLQPWSPCPGSPDFCAAAQHFIAAGLATGMDSNCVLTGTSSSVTQGSSIVIMFVRSDNPGLWDLGSIAEEVCNVFGEPFFPPYPGVALYTGGCKVGSNPINIVGVEEASIIAFTGFNTMGGTPNQDWGIYTAGPISAFPFDKTLYSFYNSVLVSDQGVSPSCDSITASNSAPNYVYLCNPSFDVWSNAMEFAVCISATGDPVAGSTSNDVAGTCPGGTGSCSTLTPTACSAVSAGFMAENLFGKNAFTIPIWAGNENFGYVSNWSGVINDVANGIPNYFTWLNAYNPSPAMSQTIRQGFSQSPYHLSPFAASSPWDFYILDNVYDSFFIQNPLNHNQIIDWMTKSHSFVTNGALGYTPPAGTTVTLRAVLRNDIFFHNGQKVTASDVAFSYMSTLLNGAFQASPIIGLMTGVTVLSSTNFDIHLKAKGPFTELTVGGITIFPGSLWYNPTSGCPTSWSALLSTPTPVTYPAVASSCLAVSPTMLNARFDPISAGVLVGSGAWVCENTGNSNFPIGTIGTGCSSNNSQSQDIGGTYTFTRYGCTVNAGGTTCVAPNTTASLQSQYFRSSANLARWFWSGDTGSVSNDLSIQSAIANCYNKPLGTAGCTPWQQGIGAPGGLAMVGLSQISAASRFYLMTSPVAWVAVNGIAVGGSNSFDGIPAPILYENDPVLHNGIELNPASIAGCSTVDPYPLSGYDC